MIKGSVKVNYGNKKTEKINARENSQLYEDIHQIAIDIHSFKRCCCKWSDYYKNKIPIIMIIMLIIEMCKH